MLNIGLGFIWGIMKSNLNNFFLFFVFGATVHSGLSHDVSRLHTTTHHSR